MRTNFIGQYMPVTLALCSKFMIHDEKAFVGNITHVTYVLAKIAIVI